MLDLVIRGGRVVTPWGVGSWDVAVAGEKIAAVEFAKSSPLPPREELMRHVYPEAEHV